MFSHDLSMGAKDHWGLANLDHRGIVGRILYGTTRHCYILNI